MFNWIINLFKRKPSKVEEILEKIEARQARVEAATKLASTIADREKVQQWRKRAHRKAAHDAMSSLPPRNKPIRSDETGAEARARMDSYYQQPMPMYFADYGHSHSRSPSDCSSSSSSDYSSSSSDSGSCSSD